MSWIRLYLTVEGETELKFANETLKPHLANFEVEVRPRMVLTNRKLGARGGAPGFERLRRDILRLIRQDAHPEARLSTMIDLYALPSDYPGWKEANKKTKPAERVAEFGIALANEISCPRFIPYLQLHEFETLLFCGLHQLSSRIEDSAREVGKLQEEVACFETPEDIDENPATAPSKRLINHVPRYERLKVLVGATAAGAIGVPTLRARCPHFGQWLARLESLKTAA